MNRPRRVVRAPAVLGALALPALLACGGGAAPPAGPPDATYLVRGEIRQTPRPGGREVLIRHESIPDLRDEKGIVVGMESMTMPFAIGPDVDRSLLAAGRRIEFTLEVRWSAASPVTVARVAPLPEGTRLEFDAPAAQPEEAPAAETPR